MIATDARAMRQGIEGLAEAIIKTAINDYKFEHGPIRKSAETFLFPECPHSLEHLNILADMAGLNKDFMHQKLRSMRAYMRGKRYFETQNSAISRRKSG